LAVRQLSPRLARLDTRSALPPPKKADPFYLSRQWRDLVEELIRVRGRKCETPGCGREHVRLFGDHVVELRDGGAPLDPRNVKLRCGSCHTKKTSAEKARRAAEAAGVGGLNPHPTGA
jgi:5-methylcytosine-specific restriction endonuclease McrA